MEKKMGRITLTETEDGFRVDVSGRRLEDFVSCCMPLTAKCEVVKCCAPETTGSECCPPESKDK